MKESVTVVLDVETAKIVACVLRDTAMMTPVCLRQTMMRDASNRVTVALNDMGCTWSPDGRMKLMDRWKAGMGVSPG